jgi:Zn-dependent oligopeptidase
VFHIAHKLYNLKFELLKNVDVYHEDVKVYKVTDEKGDEFVGIIYMDFFPRESKRGGAWMCEYQGQYIENQYDHRPHVGIVCNFTKPMASKPSLLTFSEVTTLFHEFGHALHGLLTKCRYLSQSGANVLWDFVELPSQVMENWCYEKEALDLFAKHYQSGEKIPDSLLKKLCDSRQFLEAIATVRQLYFAFLDFEWHAGNPEAIKDIGLMEKKLREKTKTYHFPTDRDVSQSTHFGHIFGGGYSAGYYSYKWAEVLDADAFEYFKQNGIFNQNIAKSFRENILAKGDTIHPMELYKKFRGKKPEIEPLLRRAGLLT